MILKKLRNIVIAVTLVTALNHCDVSPAQDSISNWSGAISGDFTSAANWDTGFAPRNGTNGFTFHQARIEATGASYDVELRPTGDTPVHSIILDSTDATLRIRQGHTLRLSDRLEIRSGNFEIVHGKVRGDVIGDVWIHSSNNFVNQISKSNWTGDITLSSSAILALEDGFTHQGDVNLNGRFLQFIGDNVYSSNSTSRIVSNGGGVNSVDGTLTIGSGVEFVGDVRLGGSIINATTIDFETDNGFANQIDNRGTIRINNGTTTLGYDPRRYGGTPVWTNEQGTIEVNGGTLLLNGVFTVAQLNPASVMRNGGDVFLIGEVDNANTTLFTTEDGGASGSIGELKIDDGAIRGGVVRGDLTIASDSSGNLLEDVEFRGNIDMTGTTSQFLRGTRVAHEGTILLGSNATLDIGQEWEGVGAGSKIIATGGSTIDLRSMNDNTFIEGEFNIVVNPNSIFANRTTLKATTGTSRVQGYFLGGDRVEVASGASLVVEDFDNNGIAVDVSENAVFTVTGDSIAYSRASYTGDGLVQFLGELSFFTNGMSVEGDLEFGESSSSRIRLYSSFFDRITVGGDLMLDGTLDPIFSNFGYSLRANQELVLFDVEGEVTGQYDNYDDGDLFGNFGGYDVFIRYSTANGNGVSLFTAVPEPNSMFVGIILLGWFGRRRRA